VEAIYNEMRKLGVTAGTTAEFSLRDGVGTHSGSRQASVTDDNQPKTSTDNDAAPERVVMPQTDTGIDIVFVCLFVCLSVCLSDMLYLVILCVFCR